MTTAEIVTTTETSTALARRERRSFLERMAPAEVLAKLEEAHGHFFGALADPNISVPERTLLAAVAVEGLRSALSGPILERVLVPLSNTAIGFDTDRNPAKGWNGRPYDPSVILDCATEAWLLGLSMTGNRWNIIGGRCYPRKEGYEDLLNQLCRFSTSVDVPAIPASIQSDGGYLTIPVRVKYVRHGEPEGSEPKVFASAYKVRATKNNPTIVENVEGKAKRKAYRDLYGELTGVYLADADGDVPASEAGVHQVGIGYQKRQEGAAADEKLAKDAKARSEVIARVKAAAESAKVDPDQALRPLGKALGELEASDELAALKAIEKAAKR